VAILPTIDAGWPVSNSISNNTATSLSVNTPVGAGNGRLLVAVVREVQGQNASVQVTGLGLTWVNVLSANYSNYINCSVWAAWAAGPVSAGQVTVALGAGATTNKLMALTVYSYVNAKNASGNILAAFGTSATNITGPSGQISLAATTANSAVLGAIGWGYNTDLTAMTDSTIDHEVVDNSTASYVAVFRYTGATSGAPVTIGSTLTSGVNARAMLAIEILGSVSVAETFLGGAPIPATKSFVLSIPAGDTEAQFLTDEDVNFIWNALAELRTAVNAGTGGTGGSGMAQVATVISEATVTVPASGTWVQVDDGVSPRPSKLSNRFKVRIVDNDGTNRAYIYRGTSTTGVNASECEAIEPQKGVWQDEVGTEMNIYVQSAGAGLTIRVIQYA
jgi:hypothetical protein